MSPKLWAGWAVLGFALGGRCVAQGTPHAVVVELFTSEGCSSCPPADALLRSINARRTVSGQIVVGISEHVTYWDRQGWKDPFSAEAYTQRQEVYRSRFGLDSSYTPQMVVNGERQVLGSDSPGLLKAMKETDHAPGPRVGTVRIGSAVLAGDKVRVTYTASGGGGVDVFAVVAEDAVTSEVGRGENSGKTLSHVSVARSLKRVAGSADGRERTVEVPSGATGDATTGNAPPGKRHVILFVQRAGLGPIEAVDVAPL